MELLHSMVTPKIGFLVDLLLGNDQSCHELQKYTVCCTAGLTAGLIKGAFMVCERISVCLGRKLFDPQRSRTACRYKLEGISPLAEENADSALTNTEQRKQLCRNGSEASQEQTEGLYKHSRRRI
ncbi:uncharacterized protein LOC102352735 isoform X4 [Latimeria chalumnae]|uniref:uncharacterized protein LOC102352735 isoform X4 n=1 Tax=Latimeria chalumnae TaxID=7897 RepID=UPI00313DB2D1